MVVLLLIFSSTHLNVKRGHFEIFWVCHMLFPVFLALNVFHGKGWFGPNYWKYLVVPGTIFALERVYREFSSRSPVALLSVTHMTSNVLSLALEKTGPLAEYKEGQYAYLLCPAISSFQWHPFTISSAPQEKTVTFHIRVQAPGSWTHKLQQYLRLLSKEGQACTDFTRIENGQQVPGKLLGPDGKRLIRVYGPHAAPTQHLTEYNETMVIASGIGVTPLAAAMKSIVHFRWKYFLGKAFPDTAHFYWVTSHAEIESFRWFVRTIKEVEDDIYHMHAKTPEAMQGKFFELHIFITSFEPSAADDEPLNIEDDIAFWGMKKHDRQNIKSDLGPFDEEMLYKAMRNPRLKGSDSVTMGHVTVHDGRPNWSQFFDHIATRVNVEKHIGVTFCGNPTIGSALTSLCHQFTLQSERTFHMHQETF
jgi:NAD(P)H-flavin reductase